METACETMTRVEPVTVDTMSDSSPTADLVVVANRLPVRRMDDGGGSAWALSSGGLVTALVPVLRESSGVWIGWPGDSSDSDVPRAYQGIERRAVRMSEQEYDDFYLGFANATLWPLYHDAIRSATFERSWWNAYRAVNEPWPALRHSQGSVLLLCVADHQRAALHCHGVLGLVRVDGSPSGLPRARRRAGTCDRRS
jgi:hypothetical protein